MLKDFYIRKQICERAGSIEMNIIQLLASSSFQHPETGEYVKPLNTETNQKDFPWFPLNINFTIPMLASPTRLV